MEYDLSIFNTLRKIPRGCRLAIILENSDKLAKVIKYCFENDLVAVPIDPSFPKEKLDFLIRHSGAYAVIKENNIIIGLNSPQKYCGDFLLIYTSGSTGDPKGVLLSKNAVIENARIVGKIHGFDRGLKHATCLPLFHCNAICMSLIGSIIYEQPFFLLNKFSAHKYINLITKNHIKTASIVPALLESIVTEKIKLPDSLDYFITAAAPLSSDLAKRFYELYGPKLVQGYGLSEAVNFSFVMPKLGSKDFVEQYINQHPPVGLPLEGCEVKIEDGEILVRNKCIMKGYLKNHNATSQVITDDGFLKTGDMGYFRGQYLVLSGRKKEIINRGGEVIYPKDVEENWRFYGLKNNFIALSIQDDLLSEEVGLWTESADNKNILNILFKSRYRPAAVQTGNIFSTSVGKPQRIKMGATLLSHTIQSELYKALSNRCREIAEKIINLPVKIRPDSRSSYIYRQACSFYSSSEEDRDVLSLLPDSISKALNMFENNIDKLISGDITGEELMKNNYGLWKKLMTEFPMGEYAKLCADFLVKRNYLNGKVLELGSGVGNTTNLILKMINNDFIRSDIGKDLNSLFPKGSYIIYDFNTCPTIKEFDTVFATNAVHCSLNKLQTLKYVYDMLKDGGSFVMAEGNALTYQNTPWALNIFYGMFDGWWNIGGFLERSEWIGLFQKAGFKEIGWSILRSGNHDLGGLIWGKK